MAFRRFSAKSFFTFSRNISNRSINTKDIGPGGFALLTVPITTFCLGTWQVKRRAWKLNLIDQVTKKSLEPPVEFPDNLEELSKMEYQKVKVRGRFDHSKELYIGPRQLLKPDVEGGGLMSSQAISGYHVVTPFHLTDRNMTILVNRGWVPKKKMDPATRPEAQINDEIELTGAVRLPETRPQFSPKTQPGSLLFLYRNVPRMAEMTGSEPIFLDACADSSIPGGPVGGQTRITFRNDHLSYLITWYSLSAATAYMWYKKYIKGSLTAIMEKIVFADTFTKTFKTVLKIPSVVIDDPIFRLHYKFTGLALLFASILVSGYEFFGNPIMCIQRDAIPESLLNTYCWIEGTFTLPKALTKHVGDEIVYPGVDNHQAGDEVTEHAYYQWVCFVLFLQAVMFCVPHVVWRTMECGRMKSLIQKLSNPLLPVDDRKTCFSSLACYFRSRKEEHHYYAMKFLFCEFLNFINVIGQIYFINKFLGGEFLKYGLDVVKYVNEEQQDRVDPMIRVFPRITKCTFHKYGSSGTVQKHDALCLLPLNILNEKIFVVMWFWFVILAILGGSLLIYRITIIVSGRARFLLLSCVSSLTSRRDIKSLIPLFSYGDWFLLYMLADNIDNLHFRGLVHELKPHKDTEEGYTYKVPQIDDVDKGKKVFIGNESTSLLDNGESTV